MADPRIPSVLYEMLLSFAALAETLNLSQAVQKLGTTRQTVRRHISALEDIFGETLFELVDRQYRLTEAGAAHLDDALAILADIQAWLSGNGTDSSALRRARLFETSEAGLHLRQHPLTEVWNQGPPLIRHGLEAWAKAGSRLEDRAMRRIRPYLVVHRRLGESWVCVDVGPKSSYATWLGWAWARSALGSTYEDDPIRSPFDRIMVGIYDTVHQMGSVWYDHVYAHFPREAGGAPVPVLYQRLVFSCAFPDGSRAIAALIARTNNVSIPHLEKGEMPRMQASDLMEFDF